MSRRLQQLSLLYVTPGVGSHGIRRINSRSVGSFVADVFSIDFFIDDD
jgi:hypothetical protein